MVSRILVIGTFVLFFGLVSLGIAWLLRKQATKLKKWAKSFGGFGIILIIVGFAIISLYIIISQVFHLE